MAEENSQNPIIDQSGQERAPESLEIYKTGWFYKLRQRIKWMTPKKKLLVVILAAAAVVAGALIYFVLAGLNDPGLRLVLLNNDGSSSNLDNQTLACGGSYRIAVMSDVDPGEHSNQNGEGVITAGADIYYDPEIFESVVIDSSGSDYPILLDEFVDPVNNIIQIVRSAPDPGLSAEDQLLAVLEVRLATPLPTAQTIMRFYDEDFGDPPASDSNFMVASGDLLDVFYGADGSGGSYTLNIGCSICPYYTCAVDGETCAGDNWYNESIRCCNEQCVGVCEPPNDTCSLSEECPDVDGDSNPDWVGDPNDRCCEVSCASQVTLCSGTSVNVIPTSNSVDFSWCTEPDSTCIISGDVSDIDAGNSRDHNFTFSGLTPPGETYSYNINCSVGGYEDLNISGSFTTLAVGDLIIRELRATDITSNRARISWVTNKLSDSQVYYWPDGGAANSIVEDTLVLAHGIDLVGLSAGETYNYYVVSATDGQNNCSGTSPTCSRSYTDSFTTEDADAAPDANVVLKVDRDRVCNEWLYCDAAVKILNNKKNPPQQEDVCFSVGVCDQLDSGGRCVNRVDESDQSVQTALHPSGVNEVRNLSGYSKAGLDWGYRCVNNRLACDCLGINVDECIDAAVCGSDLGQRCVRAVIDGYYPYSTMWEVGLPIAVANSNFEDGSVRPWKSHNGGQIALDRTEKTNTVLEIKPGSGVSGATTVNLASGIEKQTYVVSFRAKTDNTSGQDIWVEIGPYNEVDYNSDGMIDTADYLQFIYYNPETGLETPEVSLTTSWQEFVMVIDEGSWPINEDVDGPLRLTVVQTGGGPNSEFYIDNINMKTVLAVGEPLNYVARSCRMYPTQNSPACDFYDFNSAKSYRGWKGYCVETDPLYQDRRYANQPVCLQWWPVDILFGEANVFSDDPVAGYTGRQPLYYCLESSGDYEYYEKRVAGHHGGDVYGASYISRTIPVAEFDIYKDEIIDVKVKGIGIDWDIDDRCSSIKALNDKGGLDTSSLPRGAGESKTGTLIFDYQNKNYWDAPYIEAGCSSGDKNSTINKYAAVRCSGEGSENDCNVMTGRLIFDETGLLTSVSVLYDEATGDGAGWFDEIVITYYGERCNVIAQVVTPDGENTAWTKRVQPDGWTADEGNVLGYDYGQDWSPYGASVVGEPDYDPGEWDRALYVQPANSSGGGSRPYQVRAGSPYSIDSHIVGECTQGVQPGMLCSEPSQCEGYSRCVDEEGSQGTCTAGNVGSVCSQNSNCNVYLSGSCINQGSYTIPPYPGVCDINPNVGCYNYLDCIGVSITPGVCSSSCDPGDSCYCSNNPAESCTGAPEDCFTEGVCEVPHEGIGSTQCVAGLPNRLGTECDSSIECGVTGESEACVGIDLTDKQTSAIGGGWPAGEDRLSELFARSYGVWKWGWDPNYNEGEGRMRYIDVDDKYDSATQEIYGWDVTTERGTPPGVEDLWIGNDERDNFIIYEQGSAIVRFTSFIDPDQLPMVRYAVDWADGERVSEAGLRILGRQVDNPHILVHYYEYHEPGEDYPDGDETTSYGSLGLCDADRCTFNPRVQIEDNWGLCNNNSLGDCGQPDAWRISDQDIVVFREGATGGPARLAVEPLSLSYYAIISPVTQSITISSANAFANSNLDWSLVNPTNFLDTSSGDYVNYYWSEDSGTLLPGQSVEVYLTIEDIGNLAQDASYNATVDVYVDGQPWGTITVYLYTQTGATIFVSSNLYATTDIGIDGIGANNICQGLADESSLVTSGEYRAWVSDSLLRDVIYNLGGFTPRPLYLTDGSLVAVNVSDLWTSGVEHAINYDEHGASHTGLVWTGTFADGGTAANCNDWFSDEGTDVGQGGQAGLSNEGWTENQNSTCRGQARIYCIYYGP